MFLILIIEYNSTILFILNKHSMTGKGKKGKKGNQESNQTTDKQ